MSMALSVLMMLSGKQADPDLGRRAVKRSPLVADARASEKGFEGYDDEREAGDPQEDRSGKPAQAGRVEVQAEEERIRPTPSRGGSPGISFVLY